MNKVIKSRDLNTDDILDDELAHFGVLGMKWGVRKDRDSNGSEGKSKTNKYKEAGKQILSQLKTSATINAKKVDIYKAMLFDKKLIADKEKLKTKYEKIKTNNSAEAERKKRAYAADINKLFSAAVQRHAESIIGPKIDSKYKLDAYYDYNTNEMTIGYSEDIKHSAIFLHAEDDSFDNVVMKLKMILDDDGFIDTFELMDD